MWGYVIVSKKTKAKQLVTGVIGMQMMDAVTAIKAAEIEVQVLSIDGTTCATDGQFNPGRIGIVVSGGLVTGAQIG